MVTIRYESELACFKENLNQVLSVSLLMTSSTVLANVGLFELPRRPLLTRAVSSSRPVSRKGTESAQKVFSLARAVEEVMSQETDMT